MCSEEPSCGKGLRSEFSLTVVHRWLVGQRVQLDALIDP